MYYDLTDLESLILIQITPKERTKRQQRKQRQANNNKTKSRHHLTSMISWSLGISSSAKVISKCFKFMVTDLLSVFQHNYLDHSSFIYLHLLIVPCRPAPHLKSYSGLTFDLPAREERGRHYGYRQASHDTWKGSGKGIWIKLVGTFSRYLLPMFLNETWSRFD